MIWYKVNEIYLKEVLGDKINVENDVSLFFLDWVRVFIIRSMY